MKMTAQEYSLETVDERLRRIQITKTFCLGSKITVTAEKLLGKMTDKEIIDMLNDNIDVQYILLDFLPHEVKEKK
jgi:hypothetical protein